jgi:hypothetical protein
VLNNVGFSGGVEVTQFEAAACEIRGNSWQLSFAPEAADFAGVDEAELTAPRRADGSLPEISFLRLSPGSRLIDRGVDAGRPFRGAAPDLSAFGSAPANGRP